MKAVVHDRYGPPDVLRLEEVEPPVPKADEVLIRIRATTVNRTDCHRRAADPVLWRLFAGLGRPGGGSLVASWQERSWRPARRSPSSRPVTRFSASAGGIS